MRNAMIVNIPTNIVLKTITSCGNPDARTR